MTKEQVWAEVSKDGDCTREAFEYIWRAVQASEIAYRHHCGRKEHFGPIMPTSGEWPKIGKYVSNR